MKNKILVITRGQEEYRTLLAEYPFPNAELLIPDTHEEILECLPEANIILANPLIFKDYVHLAEKAEWVQSSFAGIDALCAPGMKTNYMLTNVKDAYGPHMSEYVFAYILMLEKGVLGNLEKQKNEHWEQQSYPTIQGKTIAILGTGSIGKVIAKNAASFGMKVIGYKTNTDSVEHFDEIYTKENKKELFEQADYLVSVLPNTVDTRHTVDDEALNWMKATSIFINVGRGANVDEDALVKALEEKQIAGAVLDVFQTEPLPTDHKLWNMENIFITPHVSGYVEDNSRLVEIFAKNYQKFHAGEELDYLIDFERGF